MDTRTDTLRRLEATIAERITASPEASYVAKLNSKGTSKIAQKVGEEATEVVIAAMSAKESGISDELVSESADLVFHLLVLLQAQGVSFDDVLAELDKREGLSGLDEKAQRTE